MKLSCKFQSELGALLRSRNVMFSSFCGAHCNTNSSPVHTDHDDLASSPFDSKKHKVPRLQKSLIEIFRQILNSEVRDEQPMKVSLVEQNELNASRYELTITMQYLDKPY